MPLCQRISLEVYAYGMNANFYLQLKLINKSKRIFLLVIMSASKMATTVEFGIMVNEIKSFDKLVILSFVFL